MLSGRIEAEIRDEDKAVGEYRSLAELMVKLSINPADVEQVRVIARDESQHKEILEGILRRLR